MAEVRFWLNSSFTDPIKRRGNSIPQPVAPTQQAVILDIFKQQFQGLPFVWHQRQNTSNISVEERSFHDAVEATAAMTFCKKILR